MLVFVQDGQWVVMSLLWPGWNETLYHDDGYCLSKHSRKGINHAGNVALCAQHRPARVYTCVFDR
jgi:hypothetical protein